MFSSVLILTAFFVTWAVVHSLLASLPVKNWTRRVFGDTVDRWYRLAFNIFAAIAVLPIFPMLAFLPDRTLYVVPAPWRRLMVGRQGLALVGLAGSFLQTGVFQFLGLTQLLPGSQPKPGRWKCTAFTATCGIPSTHSVRFSSG